MYIKNFEHGNFIIMFILDSRAVHDPNPRSVKLFPSSASEQRFVGLINGFVPVSNVA